MPEPSPQVAERIQRTVAAVRLATLPFLPEIEKSLATDDRWARCEVPPPEGPYRAVACTLEQEFPTEYLQSALAEIIFHPEATGLDFAGNAGWQQQAMARFVWAAAVQWTVEQFSSTAARFISVGIGYLLLNRAAAEERRRLGLPGVEPLLECLHRVGDQPEALGIVEELVRGDKAPGGLPDVPVFSKIAPRRSYDGLACLDRHWLDFLEHLHRAGRLTYDIFRSAAAARRATFDRALAEGDCPPDPFRQVLWDHCRRLIEETSLDLSEANAAAMAELGDIWGARTLVKACGEIERLGITRLRFPHSAWPEKTVEDAISRMANVRRLLPEDNPEQIVEQLKLFRRETLRLVWPLAGCAQPLVLWALDWKGLQPLVDLVDEIAAEPFGEFSQYDIPNCEDPRAGVVDRRQVESLLQAVDMPAAASLLSDLRDARAPGANAAMLVAAVAGANQHEVLAGIKKRNQVAVKAWGLLPLAGDDELRERYRLLRQFERGSRNRPVGQQANERAAVQAALANLAQTAGYADATELEWSMEDQLDDARQRSPRAVGDWELRLDVNGRQPRVVVLKKGKPLKSVPAAVRKSEAYAELTEAAGALAEQSARLRDAFEKMMAESQALDRPRLERLLRVSNAAAQLGRLLFRTDDGAVGRLRPEDLALVDISGRHMAISPSVKLAHPWDLFQAGVLAGWQHQIVRDQVVQPFKQAFRELYVLTPAETATATFSERLSGHVLASRVAAALFRSRGWRTGEVCHKRLAAFGLIAAFEFIGMGHFFTELESIESGRIFFVGLDSPQWRDPASWVPLQEVPPLAFSETMRDADLAVSVAQRGDEGYFSAEMYQNRADVIRALVEQLSIDGVSVEEHFVRVEGKRAVYRIHLGSSNVFIEPGHHICIVPERRVAAAEEIYLPFSDTADRKAAELVSKLILLANDDRIEDQSILSQIEDARQR